LYHPAVDDPAPSRILVAGEDAWEVRVGDAVLRFGAGPARGSGRGRERAAAIAAEDGWQVATAAQVHGARVAAVVAGGRPPVPGCDGLVTGVRDLALVVWSADCVPLLVAGGGAVAAVHAGWRGTAAGIVGAAVEALATRYRVPPEGLTAWLGPAVCGRHYEVGPEVVEALSRSGVPQRAWRRGRHVDLRLLIRRQLERIGVPPGAIGEIEACTVEDRSLASYRRDGADAGRQWSSVVRCSPLS
jgi:YfiH family protein